MFTKVQNVYIFYYTHTHTHTYTELYHNLNDLVTIAKNIIKIKNYNEN